MDKNKKIEKAKTVLEQIIDEVFAVGKYPLNGQLQRYAEQLVDIMDKED